MLVKQTWSKSDLLIFKWRTNTFILLIACIWRHWINSHYQANLHSYIIWMNQHSTARVSTGFCCQPECQPVWLVVCFLNIGSWKTTMYTVCLEVHTSQDGSRCLSCSSPTVHSGKWISLLLCFSGAWAVPKALYTLNHIQPFTCTHTQVETATMQGIQSIHWE